MGLLRGQKTNPTKNRTKKNHHIRYHKQDTTTEEKRLPSKSVYEG